MTALAGVVCIALGLAMWGITIAVQSAPRVGALLPAPAWPWAVHGYSRAAAFIAIATATVAVFALVGGSWSPQHLPLLLLIVLGLPAAYTDARELRLPNELTYGLAVSAAASVVVLDLLGGSGIAVRALAGGAGYALLLLAVAVLTPTGRPGRADSGTATLAPTALGLGDVKFAAGVGIVLGWTSISALLTGIALMAIEHLVWTCGCAALRPTGVVRAMNGSALGPWILAAALAVSATSP
jgi:prepilin signal peptidase PulO-like enzyme (type II secretory pathway)